MIGFFLFEKFKINICIYLLLFVKVFKFFVNKVLDIGLYLVIFLVQVLFLKQFGEILRYLDKIDNKKFKFLLVLVVWDFF